MQQTLGSSQHEVQTAVNEDLHRQKAKEKGKKRKSTCWNRKIEWRDPGEHLMAPSKNAWTKILRVFPLLRPLRYPSVI